MASQGWLLPRRSRLKNVACAIGLAVGGLVVLLLCLDWGAPALAASGSPGVGPVRGPAWAETGELSATWTSYQPTSTLVDSEPLVWPIPQHGVTVTFYRSAVVGQAWFTFTPKSSVPLTGSYLPTPYFFDLDSAYVASDLPVSLGRNGIQIELVYDESRLGEIEPRTLQFFHFGATAWEKEGGELDLVAKTLSVRTTRTESFGVGGQPTQTHLYLAFVVRQ